ncbi:MAG: LacI family transcriptional regulator [Clostridiales bacterium]|nr:LacI family transcriptional regulator [Clostridiales bacterium]MDR2750768.1 LacI family transcriptional regulator [Clostridiales bacterium]
MNKTATREDVAKAAGVSVASVSRAVNNSGYVKKEVKEKILDVARSLGYNPNPIALSLQSRKTKQLILYQNEITAPYNIQFFNGATRVAYKRGYSIFLDIHCDFEKIKSHLVDGVMFSLDVLAETYINSVGANYLLPVVVATNDASLAFARPVHNVIIDNPKVVNMAIDYLMSKGHRRIGMVIPERGRHSAIRYQLWKTRMEQEAQNFRGKMSIQELVVRAEIGDTDNVLAKRVDPPLIMQPSDDNFANYSSFNIGKRAAHKYLEGHSPATALLCFNDDIAYGFMSVLKDNNVRVPEDISIMGIDGIYLREWFDKKVTTVSIEVENLGAVAADVMIDILEGNKPKYMNWTTPKLLEGDTVRDVN